MDNKKVLEQLLSNPTVKEELNKLMINTLATHRLNNPVKEELFPDMPEVNPINKLYTDLLEISQELQIDFHERLNTPGIMGQTKNYNITKGIAKLKLHLDIMSEIFKKQNIDAEYRKMLEFEFAHNLENIDDTHLGEKQHSLLSKLLLNGS